MPIVHVDPRHPGAPIMEAKFGFLSVPETWRIGEFVVEPVGDFATAVEEVREDGHEGENRYYAPPLRNYSLLDGNAEPRSRTVAELFPVVPTHTLRRSDGGTLGPSEEFRTGEGLVVIRALSFLYDARCEFHWFDGAIPIKPKPICFFRTAEAAEAVAAILERYRQNRELLARRLPNILLMKSRFICYPWVWEQFLVEYTVFDSLWRIADRRGVISRPSDPDGRRLYKRPFDFLGERHLIHWGTEEQQLGQRFVDARNELVHEALFERATGWRPQDEGPDLGSLFSLRLRDLTARFLFTALGVPCAFARSSWTRFGTTQLGLCL